MLYKPNFCCNCGEKIERIEWNLLTSRRFCPSCAVEHRRHDYLPRLALAAGSLALMFGVGSFWAGSAADGSSVAQPVGIRSAVPSVEAAKTSAAPSLPVQQQVYQPPPSPETVQVETKTPTAHYYCGALTKKGTPCSRKVKAKGIRCFQHEGRPEAPQT